MYFCVMNLFSNGTVENKLPKDGTVFYYGILMSIQQADHYLERLLNTIEWKNDEAVIFGKHIITKRKVAWYGNDSYSYTYSNTTKTALPWTQELMELKQLAEATTGATYNSCLLNLYHDGSEGMAWHSDFNKSAISIIIHCPAVLCKCFTYILHLYRCDLI